MTQNAYALFWRDYRFGWREMEGKDESMEGIGGKSPPGTPLIKGEGIHKGVAESNSRGNEKKT